MTGFRKEFIAFSIDQGVLKFGDFVTTSGRRTRCFFNAGLFNSGASLDRLGQFYAPQRCHHALVPRTTARRSWLPGGLVFRFYFFRFYF